MKIGVLGTGGVGSAIASKLVSLGHDVKMGSRSATSDKALAWVASAGSRASAGTFADAAAFGELVFNCTNGNATLEALRAAGAEAIGDKVLVDLGQPAAAPAGARRVARRRNTAGAAARPGRQGPQHGERAGDGRPGAGSPAAMRC